MGVVELEDIGIFEMAQIAITAFFAAHAALQSGRNQEILLAETKHPTMFGRIIRIEAEREFLEGAEIFIECAIGRQILFRRFGRPKPQGIADPIAVAHDAHIIRDGADASSIDGPNRIGTIGTKVGFGVAIEFDIDRMI